MKRIIITLSFLVLLIQAQGQNFDKNFTLKINSKSSSQDTFHIIVSSMISVKEERIEDVDTFVVNSAREHSFKLGLGLYTIGVFSKKTAPLRKNLIVETSGQQISMEANLKKVGLPSKIKSIKLIGEFDGWDVAKGIKLVKKGDEWSLKEPVSIPMESSYSFSINDTYQISSLSIPLKFIFEWGHFDHIYKGERIIFNTSLYEKGLQVSTATITGAKGDPAFDSVYVSLRNIIQELNTVENDTVLSDSERGVAATRLKDKIEVLEKANPTYKMLFSDAYLQLTSLHPGYLKFRKLNLEKADSAAITQFVYTGEVKDYLLTITNILEKVDFKSPYLHKRFLLRTMPVADILHRNPPYGKEINLTTESYLAYIDKYIEAQPNKKVGLGILINLAYMYQDIGNSAIVERLVNKMKKDFGDDRFVKEGYAQKLLESMDVKAGAMAPEFKVKLTTQDTVQLTDFKGKFVFIDVWGTWCGPCRTELPNVIRLSQEIPKDKLIVLGLAGHDTEEILTKFIAKQNIPYPNAVASKEILEKFKIMSFPTTFLLDPNGKIIAKNLRGENLTELVKARMEQE